MTPQISGVTLAEKIGAGGFGIVYRGVQTMIGRNVAVKVDSRTLTDERDRRRFDREITAAGRVSAHPNIVTLYDAGINADGRPFLVMELYTGGSYADRMKSTTPIPAAEVLDVGIAIADALAAAHDEGILHRDVKPGNILISRYGTPALADFGLAALPRPGVEASVTLEALTPAYSSPESFALTAPSSATDIFGLGSTLYALLKGGPPRSDQSGQSPSLPHLLFLLNQPLPALESRPEAAALMQVIWKATATDPLDRYANAAEMRDDLMLVKAGYPLVRPQSRPHAPTGHPPRSGQIPEPPTTSLREKSDLHATPVRSSGTTGSRTRALLIGAVVAVLLIVTALVLIPKLSAGTPSGTALVTESTPMSAADSTADQLPSGSLSAPSATELSVLPEPSVGSPTAASPPQPASPEIGQCFAGLVTIGDSRTASVVSSCTEPHYWESFASGVLDPATPSPLLGDVVDDPNVEAACTQDALGTYLGDAADGNIYSIEVVPPREALFYQGDKGFHCVASLEGGGEVTTSIRGS